MATQKKTYQTPVLEAWGAVTDLTATGQTHAGSDAKNGSVASQGQ